MREPGSYLMTTLGGWGGNNTETLDWLDKAENIVFGSDIYINTR
jgi:hypothetical protein